MICKGLKIVCLCVWTSPDFSIRRGDRSRLERSAVETWTQGTSGDRRHSVEKFDLAGQAWMLNMKQCWWKGADQLVLDMDISWYFALSFSFSFVPWWWSIRAPSWLKPTTWSMKHRPRRGIRPDRSRRRLASGWDSAEHCALCPAGHVWSRSRYVKSFESNFHPFRAMASNLRAMASNLLVMASTLRAMASNLMFKIFTQNRNHLYRGRGGQDVFLKHIFRF